jgi:acetate kinase
LLALAGVGSNDLRDVIAAAEAGNAQAGVALEIFCYRIRKYIVAFAAVMGGLDAVVFTAGVGENSPQVRERVCAGLGESGGFGLLLDAAKNTASGSRPRAIHAEGSRVRVLVVPTNEELEIARETLQVLAERGTPVG